jgi:hypothetical protein
MTIQMTGADEYKLSARGCDFTLKREGDRWAMYVVNAAVLAWRRGFAIPGCGPRSRPADQGRAAGQGITGCHGSRVVGGKPSMLDAPFLSRTKPE